MTAVFPLLHPNFGCSGINFLFGRYFLAETPTERMHGRILVARAAAEYSQEIGEPGRFMCLYWQRHVLVGVHYGKRETAVSPVFAAYQQPGVPVTHQNVLVVTSFLLPFPIGDIQQATQLRGTNPCETD